MRASARQMTGYAHAVEAYAEQVIHDPRIFAAEPTWATWQTEQALALAFAAWLNQSPRYASLASRLMDRAASAESWGELGDSSVVGCTLAQGIELLGEIASENQTERYESAIREKLLDGFGAADVLLSDRVNADTALAALGTVADPKLLTRTVERAFFGLSQSDTAWDNDVDAKSIVRLLNVFHRWSDTGTGFPQAPRRITANPFQRIGCAQLWHLDLANACLPTAQGSVQI
jgi:hypothetical protein